MKAKSLKKTIKVMLSAESRGRDPGVSWVAKPPPQNLGSRSRVPKLNKCDRYWPRVCGELTVTQIKQLASSDRTSLDGTHRTRGYNSR